MNLTRITASFFLIMLAALSAILISARPLLSSGGSDSIPGANSLLRRDSLSSIAILARFLGCLNFSRWLTQRMRDAELDWSAGRVFFMMLLAGTLALTGLMRIDWVPFPIALVIALSAAGLPVWFILRRRKAKLQGFLDHFPDSIDSLCRALRAGHPFAAGVEMIASEGAAPVSIEFRRMLDEWRLGASWNDALDHFAARLPLTETGVFCAAVKQQMKSGGRLGDVLSRLSESMREAIAIEGEVRATAAQARLSGRVLTLLPVVIALVLFQVNPEQMQVLTGHPWGRVMIWTAMGLVVLAHFVIRRIADVRY